MEQFKFKTNINCGGCIGSVKPHLDNIKEIKEWSVDTDNPEKILTVKAENINAETIIETVNKAGFKCEKID